MPDMRDYIAMYLASGQGGQGGMPNMAQPGPQSGAAPVPNWPPAFAGAGSGPGGGGGWPRGMPPVGPGGPPMRRDRAYQSEPGNPIPAMSIQRRTEPPMPGPGVPDRGPWGMPQEPPVDTPMQVPPWDRM